MENIQINKQYLKKHLIKKKQNCIKNNKNKLQNNKNMNM